MSNLADLMTEDRRAKLSREMTHQQSYSQIDPSAQAMVDYARVTQDPNYVEPGLQGGVPTENVTGLGLSPLDLIGTGIGTKAATLGGSMLAALAGTAIASKASKGTRLSELAMAMPSQRGYIGDIPAPAWNQGRVSVPVGENPTPSEIRELLRDKQAKSAYNTLRTLTDKRTGNIYAWPADAALHQDVGAAYGLTPSNTIHGLIAP